MRTPRSTGVPVVLPLVDVVIDEGGGLMVTVDKVPHDIGDNVVPTRRAGLGRVLSEITTGLDSPVRVKVREADGSVFTDILTPAQPPPTRAATEGLRASLRPVDARGGLGLAMDGFTPGESVAVAVILTQTTADTDGVAHLQLPAALLAKHPGSVALLGRISGTVAFSDDTPEPQKATEGAA